MEYYREELFPFVFLTALRTDKFKTACLSVSLLTQLDGETAAEYAILPYLLCRGTKFLPDKKAISEKLDELYGASLEPVVRKWGEIQAIGLCADFCEDRFLPGDTRVLAEITRLLGDVLLSPNTRGGLFLPAYVDSEKEKLAQRMDSLRNDKRSYARRRLEEEMCAFEPFAVNRLGHRDAVDDIYYVNLTKSYRKLLATAPVELFYCGSADGEDVARSLREVLMAMPRGEIDTDMGTDIRMNAVEASPRYFTEEMDVSQGNLALGFRLGGIMDDPNIPAVRVYNAILGGYVNSRLFTHVREEKSLCYFVGSMVNLHKGLLEITAGIDPGQYETALAAILEQVEAMRRGEITESELIGARKYLASAFRSLTDKPDDLEFFWQGQTILGLDYGPEELSALTEEVTMEDVLTVARSVELDAVYFLRKEAEA